MGNLLPCLITEEYRLQHLLYKDYCARRWNRKARVAAKQGQVWNNCTSLRWSHVTWDESVHCRHFFNAFGLG